MSGPLSLGYFRLNFSGFMIVMQVMSSYVCKIGMPDGRIVEKEFSGDSSALLRESLEEQGFYVFGIRKKGWSLFGAEKSRTRLGGRQFLTFNQELLVLIRSGLPILKVLDTLVERTEPGGLRSVLEEVRTEVRGGAALSEAFARFPGQFPHLYIASIQAGERTGDLPVTLLRFVAYQKRVEAIKAKVKAALFYPALLSLMAGVVLVFLLTFVVPRFTQVYADAAMELPLLTRLLMGVASFFADYYLLLFLGAAALVAFLRSAVKTERGRNAFDQLRLQLPFFGGLARDYAVSSFCRTLSTILAGGIPIVSAFRMARGTLNNSVLERRALAAIKHVEEGAGFSPALEKMNFFPTIALRMISVGEQGGSLPDMLSDVSEYYEGLVEQRLEQLTSIIEPLIMMAMGVLIGVILLAMYIPIFQLAGTVQ